MYKDDNLAYKAGINQKPMSWSECIEYLSKLARYIKLNSGKFNTNTRDIMKGLHGIPGLNELYIIILPCDLHGINKLSDSGLNVLSVKKIPCEVNGLNELSFSLMNTLSGKVCPHDVRKCGEILSESGLHGLNGLGTESSQKYTLSQTEF